MQLFVYRLNSFLTNSICRVIRISKSPVFTFSNAARCLCSNPIQKNISQSSIQKSEKFIWTPIYYFPLIGVARFLNRLKLYQTAFTFLTLPLSVGLYYYDLTNLTTIIVVSGTAIFTCVTVYIATSFFKRLIGSIFVDKEFKNVKIAHLTFWGNRTDIIVPIDEIIPLTDDNCNAYDAFIKLHRYNSEDYFYLTLKFGKFLDTDAFQKIFGSFEVLGFRK